MRVYRQARKVALEAAAQHFVEHILPGHFKSGAERKYGYKERTFKYVRKKRREGKGYDPNVYTGRLRDLMLSKRPKARVTKDGVSLTWRGLPRYTFMTDTVETVKSGKRKGQVITVERPNKPEELTAVNKADADLLATAFQKGFDAVVARGGYGRRR
jgi:hypothetical protein